MIGKKFNSSPYVYPFEPFYNLGDKDLKVHILSSRKISWSELNKLVEQIDTPKPKIKGETVAEKILSIFLDEKYRFGPKEYIENSRKKWIDKFNYFIDRNESIKFTILGFPFKVPVPLKTNRKLPDMGDVLALLRLNVINRYIKSTYNPGAKTYVFTEGPFGKFAGVPARRVSRYMNFLQEITNKLGFSENLKLIDLSELEKNKSFKKIYPKWIKELKKKYRNKDKTYMKMYQGTYNSIYRIVGTENYSESVLMDVYNEGLPKNKLTPKVKKIRKEITRRAHKAIIDYHAYLMTKDDMDYIQTRVPNSIPLSVSPKPDRLGINPIDDKNIRIPHHSITVYYPENKEYLLEYLIDVRRKHKRLMSIYLKGDKDVKPFYYVHLA